VGPREATPATAYPEPPRPDPSADYLTREELLKQQRWSDADLSVALGGVARIAAANSRSVRHEVGVDGATLEWNAVGR
jgi:hypothetical protein